MSTKSISHNSNESSRNSIWTSQDDAEYNRLAVEMNEDGKLQFTLFTFGVTTSTAILGLLSRIAIETNATGIWGLPPGFFFLVPLMVLLPTSLVILNRARTRNRKAAYIVVYYDYKRLVHDCGITDDTSLEQVRKLPFIPWETALHILDRTNPQHNRPGHLAPALKYMAYCYYTIEILCVILAIYTSLSAPWVLQGILLIFATTSLLVVYRDRRSTLRMLNRELSIQGFVKAWLEISGRKGNLPRYLKEWIEEIDQGIRKPPPRV